VSGIFSGGRLNADGRYGLGCGDDEQDPTANLLVEFADLIFECLFVRRVERLEHLDDRLIPTHPVAATHLVLLLAVRVECRPVVLAVEPRFGIVLQAVFHNVVYSGVRQFHGRHDKDVHLISMLN
jgi:hypothetical protein